MKMDKHERITQYNDSIVSLKSAKFKSGNWAGWTVFSSDIRHIVFRKSCLAATCDMAALGNTEFVNDMNNAIQPVLDKWVAIYQAKLNEEVGLKEREQ